MLQNIWYILRRKTMPVLILISGSQRCLPICADLPSGMHWGQYPLIKHGWIYGKRQTERVGKPKLVYENHAMPVFYRDVMYREGAEGKDEAIPETL